MGYESDNDKILIEYSIAVAEYYLRMGQPVVKSDLIVGLGSRVDLTAIRASELYLNGIAPRILFTGRGNKPNLTEAENFRDIAVSMGVPNKDIVLEKEATDTHKNAVYSRRVLEELGIFPRTSIIVCVPYHERRSLATFQKQWPEVRNVVTSPDMDFASYIEYTGASPINTAKTVVKEVKKIRDYAVKGDITEHPTAKQRVVWLYYQILETYTQSGLSIKEKIEKIRKYEKSVEQILGSTPLSIKIESRLITMRVQSL